MQWVNDHVEVFVPISVRPATNASWLAGNVL
jgi:hypothetical protein